MVWPPARPTKGGGAFSVATSQSTNESSTHWPAHPLTTQYCMAGGSALISAWWLSGTYGCCRKWEWWKVVVLQKCLESGRCVGLWSEIEGTKREQDAGIVFADGWYVDLGLDTVPENGNWKECVGKEKEILRHPTLVLLLLEWQWRSVWRRNWTCCMSTIPGLIPEFPQFGDSSVIVLGVSGFRENDFLQQCLSEAKHN